MKDVERYSEGGIPDQRVHRLEHDLPVGLAAQKARYVIEPIMLAVSVRAPFPEARPQRATR
jgi:hypothetical protein